MCIYSEYGDYDLYGTYVTFLPSKVFDDHLIHSKYYVQREKFYQKIDHAFVDALDHGLPHTGGFGLGIDRLCMLITGQPNIKEVLTFPMMRPLNL